MKYFEQALMFKIIGTPTVIIPYGMGHINETYYVETNAKHKYILQKINSKIFTNIEMLMNNINLVTEHIRSKLIEQSEIQTLTIIKTHAEKLYYESNNEYFRMYIFIDNATSHQTVTNHNYFYQSAVGYGTFANFLTDFDASQLYETIPDFHNTSVRYKNFEESVNNDIVNRVKNVKKEIDFIAKRQHYCNKIVSLINNGNILLRVTHNDTKLNNVLLSNDTGKAVAVIDLDTVMFGSCCYDFGDSIRFGCNSSAEDEQDLSKVNFQIDLFEVYAKGYINSLNTITNIEKENLAFSALLLTYECGMRFLTDYLNGDVYFKINRANHNLIRAKTQFKLLIDMEKMLPSMQKIIERI